MRLDAGELVAEAQSVAGLEDFGSDSFREGLDAYCRSVANEAQLNAVGTMGVHGTVVASLANRLRVVDWAARHPDVRSERVDAPLVVIGMFRAGTTFLSCRCGPAGHRIDLGRLTEVVDLKRHQHPKARTVDIRSVEITDAHLRR